MNSLPYNVQVELQEARGRQQRATSNNKAVQWVLFAVVVGVWFWAPAHLYKVLGAMAVALLYNIGSQLDRFDCVLESNHALLKALLEANTVHLK